MNVKTDILHTLLFGVIMFLLIMFIAGYSEADYPYDPLEDIKTGCKFPCEFPAPVYHLAAESLKYQTRGK